MQIQEFYYIPSENPAVGVLYFIVKLDELGFSRYGIFPRSSISRPGSYVVLHGRCRAIKEILEDKEIIKVESSRHLPDGYQNNGLCSFLNEWGMEIYPTLQD